ncbi:MAG: carboxypeptidase-like regulatory domain-containing protein [Planctomycetaceae bacterium]|nr:carboxypeptidase-like regulatory domain-containing protein [Planctomycetaceae bacterium]
MTNERILYHFVLLIFLLLPYFGCNGSPHPHDLPPLYPAVLVLTQEGKPLENALVVLYSTDSNFKWSVAAVSDRNGKATLLTHGKFFGVPAGEYKIIITKTEASDQNVSDSNSSHNPEVYTPIPTRTLFSLVEKQYTDIATTPFTIIIEKGKNVQNLDIGKAVREKFQTVTL